MEEAKNQYLSNTSFKSSDIRNMVSGILNDKGNFLSEMERLYKDICKYIEL